MLIYIGTRLINACVIPVVIGTPNFWRVGIIINFDWLP
jgi:hypothetical protein